MRGSALRRFPYFDAPRNEPKAEVAPPEPCDGMAWFSRWGSLPKPYQNLTRSTGLGNGGYFCRLIEVVMTWQVSSAGIRYHTIIKSLVK